MNASKEEATRALIALEDVIKTTAGDSLNQPLLGQVRNFLIVAHRKLPTITIGGFSPDLVEELDREGFREALKEFWSSWMGGPVGVRFEDECGDCGAEMKPACSNPNCVSRMPED